jgi:hypothetical protein
MPTARIPLVGSFNQRTIDGAMTLALNEDQRFLNVAFDVVQNPVTGKATVYCEKRPGWGVDSIVAAGSVSTGLIKTDSVNSVVSAFGATNSTIYDGQVSVGVITGRALYFSETLISNVGYVLIKSSDGTGWYYPSDAKDVTAYTADGNNSTTITDIKIGGVNSTAGLYSGQLLAAATNIVAGTRVVSVNAGAFTAVLDTATNGGAFNDLAITKEPIAKIIDADFVTTGEIVTAFVEMDGYIFYGNADGYLYNSDLNSVISWAANSRINPAMTADPPNALGRHKNMVVVFGAASMEVFYNAGYATGSPVTRAAQFYSRIGALDQRSVTTLKDDIYYAASAKYGDVAIYRLRNLSPQPISTPAMNKIIGTISATGGYIYMSGFELGGHAYVSAFCTNQTEDEDLLLLETGEQLLLETGDGILLDADPSAAAAFAHLFVYSVDLNTWSEWDCSEATYIAGIGSGPVNQLIATSRVDTDGKVYTIKPSSYGELYTDDGAAYTMEIRTSKLDFGTENRKFVNSIRLIADDAPSGTATLEASNDDFQTWETLGTFDMTQHEKRISRCGSHKGGRAYRLRHSSNAPFRGEALQFDYKVGNA